MFACEYNSHGTNYKLIAPNGLSVGYAYDGAWYYRNNIVTRGNDNYHVASEYYLFFRNIPLALINVYYDMDKGSNTNIECYELECKDISMEISELIALDNYCMNEALDSMFRCVISYDAKVKVDVDEILDDVVRACNCHYLSDDTIYADASIEEDTSLVMDIRVRTTSYMASIVKRRDLAPNVYIVRDES